MRNIRFVGLAAAVAVVLSGAVATAADAASVAGGRCRLGWQRTLRLGNDAGGHEYRVCPGTKVDVALSAPVDGAPWSPIVSGDRSVVAERYHRPVFTPRGVTVGFFVARHRGDATLTSTRPVCPTGSNPGGVLCHAMQGWNVTLAVRP